MNVAAHQEKKEEMKTDEKKAGEERKQKTDFKKAAYCSSAIVQAVARRKNGLCEGESRVNGAFGKANSHFDPTHTGSGTTSLR